MVLNDIKKLTKAYVKFRDERDWKQFHRPKDLAVSMMLEAGEVLEHFQWKSEKEIDVYVKKHASDIAEELADVLSYILLLCHELNIDIIKSAYKKMEQNGRKYLVTKSKGNATKYTKL